VKDEIKKMKTATPKSVHHKIQFLAPGANGPTVQNTVMEAAKVELAIVLMVLAAKEIALKMNLVTPILVLHALAGKNGVNAQNRAMAAKETVPEHALTKMVTDLVTENLKTVTL